MNFTEHMDLDLFDYKFDEKLIAKFPLKNRADARLLVVDVKKFKMEHRHFYDIKDYIGKNDVVIANNSFVKKARIFGRRLTGGRVEIFITGFPFNISYPLKLNALLKSHKNIKAGEEILITEEINKSGSAVSGLYKKVISSSNETGFVKSYTDISGIGKIKTDDYLTLKALKDNGNGNYDILIMNKTDGEFIFDKCAQIPLPPYLKRDAVETDAADYQTIYADNTSGYSVAAPTAGLHFNENIINTIRGGGGRFANISLNIGLGTFMPVREKDIRSHNIHHETYTITDETAGLINNALKYNNKIILTGTSTVRCLESAADEGGAVTASAEMPTSLYIYPGYKFKITKNLITNFHQPKSSLFIMICALIGIDKTKAVYAEAVKNNYSLFSYGDAMYLHNI